MKNTLKALTAISVIIQLSACTTTNSKPAEKLDSSNIFETSSEKVVVQRMGDKKPVISPFGRNHWIKARSSKKASLQRIQGLLATGESLEAERTARRFLANNPGNLEGLTALSSALAMSGQYDLASYYAKLVSKKLPENPHSLNIQGLASLMGAKRIAEYRRAENFFQRSFDSSSSEISAGLNLGQLYLELGNSASALEIFETTNKRCNNCIPALMGYGVAARRLGKYPEALVAFKNVLSEDKNHTPAMYHLALVYRDGMGDLKKSEQSLRSILAVQSTSRNVKEHAHTLLRSMRAQANIQAIAIQKSEEEKNLLSVESKAEGNTNDSWAKETPSSTKDEQKSIPEALNDEIANEDFNEADSNETNNQETTSDFDKYENQNSENTEVAESTDESESDNDTDFEITDSSDDNDFRKDDTFNAEFETQSGGEDSF